MIIFSPTAKIILYVLLVVVLFLIDSLWFNAGLLIIVLAICSKIPLSNLLRGVIPITCFMLFTFLSNVLFQPGRSVYELWGLAVTEEGLMTGGHLTLRLFIMILGAKILTATTSTEELVKAMTGLLGPAAKLKPVREFMFTMSLTLRFLPIIYDEAQILYEDTIKNSSDSTLLNKIRLSASLISPLFERSFKRARELQCKIFDGTD